MIILTWLLCEPLEGNHNSCTIVIWNTKGVTYAGRGEWGGTCIQAQQVGEGYVATP